MHSNTTSWLYFVSITSSSLIVGSTAVAQTGNPPASTPTSLSMFFDSPKDGNTKPIVLSGNSEFTSVGEGLPPPEEWPDSDDRADFDFARSAAGGQIPFVSSQNGENSFQMVDGDPETFYEFEDAEQEAYFVVSLAEPYPVYQASITTTNPIARVEMWAFNNNPEEFLNGQSDPGDQGSQTETGRVLSERAPAGQLDVPVDEDLTTLTIPLPDTTARYMLVRVVGKYPDLPIQVRLFSVLGNVPREFLLNRNDRSNVARPQIKPKAKVQEPLPDVPRIPVASP